ncbi:MAG TPA: GntR family transcriptional regulator [Armatimonadota bacterium]|nr:GntR family transcriptional regulator [Armatimonadota bacterium]
MSKETTGEQEMSNSTTTPAYEQIEGDLRARIIAGEWPLGVMLPSQRSLARHYHVGISTMQRAQQHLLDAGILTAEDRRGVFVARIPAAPEHTDVDPSEIARTPDLQAATALTRIGIIFYLGRAREFDDPTDPDPWTPNVIRALERTVIEHEARCYCYRVHCLDQSAYPSVDAAVQAALKDQVQALAMVNLLHHDSWLFTMPKTNHAIGIPFVSILIDELPLPFPHICVDQQNTGFLAAQHLLETGYTRILVVRPFMETWFEKRIDGAFSAVRHADLTDDTIVITPKTTDLPSNDQFFKQPAQQRAEQLQHIIDESILNDPAITQSGHVGIIAPNDRVATEMLPLLRARQITLGKDVGLISFDNDLWAAADGLSTLHPPLEEMGATAANILLDALHGRRLPTRISLCSQVIQRASTQRR